MSAGEALLRDPINTRLECKLCGRLVIGAREAIEHEETHTA